MVEQTTKKMPKPAGEGTPKAWPARGRVLWARLHHWAMSGRHRSTPDWLSAFAREIPCGDCRQHWNRVVKQNPPDYSSTAALFAWSVKAHNLVNRRIGKKTVSLDKAIAYWSEQEEFATASGTSHGQNAVGNRSLLDKGAGVSNASQSPSVRIDCMHAKPHTRAMHVTCALGLYRSAPHVALCAQCKSRCPAVEKPAGAKAVGSPQTGPAKPGATAAPAAVVPQRTPRPLTPTPQVSVVSAAIDLVYLWVDGTDPAWQESYRRHVGGKPSFTRYTDAGELRASIESAMRYAPWLRNIYLVTDGQRPAWLDAYPKVRLVEHRQIIPAEYLPTFSSPAIEAFIHRIDGLAEHLLYANDDMMFAASVRPEQFFDQNGLALMPFSSNAKGGRGGWRRSCQYAAEMLDGLFGVREWRIGWHHIKPYRRSMLAEVAGRFSGAVKDTAVRKTRSSLCPSFNCVLWPGYGVAAGYARGAARGVLRARYINAGADDLDSVLGGVAADPPHLLCINNASPEREARIRDSLSRFMPSSAQQPVTG